MDKIVFLDVDGTLVDYENRIPLSAVKAIRLARQNGHRTYICTGRGRAEICGKLGADLELTEEFVRMGLDELSVALSMVLRVRKAVRETLVSG